MRSWLDTRIPSHPLLRMPPNRGRFSVRVPDEIRKCVCFIYHEKPDGRRVPVGTAFFASVDRTHGCDGGWIHLVTARHVLAKIKERRPDGNFLLRLNAAGGKGVLWMPINVDLWANHPDESLADDVAVVPWNPPPEVDFAAFPLESSATPSAIEANDIGVGDELFFPGLFVNHVGQERNIPIVRTGNIAAMPEEPVAAKHFGKLEAYLVEARSIGGLSGSPVFAHLGLFRRIDGRIKRAQTTYQGIFYLLGLVHGHYDTKVPIADEAKMDGLSEDVINQGIAVVVPATRILENVNRPEWVAMREEQDRLAAEDLLPTADVADANDEFERFEGLTRKLVNVPKKDVDEKRRADS